MRAGLDPLPSSPALEAQPLPGRLMRRTKQDMFEWMDTWMKDLVTYLLGGQRPVVFYVLSYLKNTDTKILEQYTSHPEFIALNILAYLLPAFVK